MKKLLSLILAACLAITAVSAASAAVNGDVDYDDRLSASDARLILRASVGLEKFDNLKKLIGDIDFDDKLTASDARLALRASVGLESAPSKVYQNEYEAYAGGHFRADITTIDSTFSSRMTAAITENAMKISVDDMSEMLGEDVPFLKGQSVSILTTGKTNYLILDDLKTYFDLPAALMDDFGGDLTQMFASADTPDSLSDAASTKKAAYKGVDCTVYTFTAGGMKEDVYMNGRRLVAIADHYSDGDVITEFDHFSVYVPTDEFKIPDGYSSELFF